MTQYISVKAFSVDDYNPLESKIKDKEGKKTDKDVLIAGIILLVVAIVALALLINFGAVLSVAAICFIAIGITIVFGLGVFFASAYRIRSLARERMQQHAKVMWYINVNGKLSRNFLKMQSDLQLRYGDYLKNAIYDVHKKAQVLQKKRNLLAKESSFLGSTSGFTQAIGSKEPTPFSEGMEELANDICNAYDFYNIEYHRIKNLYPKEHKVIAQRVKKTRNEIKKTYNKFAKIIRKGNLSSKKV